jgi:hypothetical protein
LSASKTVIHSSTWQKLVELNENAARSRLVQHGVFAAGIGPGYVPGRGLLYVGKSAGPLGRKVGSDHNQAESAVASAQWMLTRQNRSAFWQFADRIDSTREAIAWTNVCKMDVPNGGRPPRGPIWEMLRSACMDALQQEITRLDPRVVVFAIGNDYRRDVSTLLERLGYLHRELEWEDGYTKAFHKSERFAFQTRHPQGWASVYVNRVIEIVRRDLALSKKGGPKDRPSEISGGVAPA